MSYLGATPTARVTPETVVTVVVPAYNGQDMTVPNDGNPEVACLLTSRQGADGSVRATFLAREAGTCTLTAGTVKVSRAAMPAYRGDIIVSAGG